MANPALGTRRHCQSCNENFYDLKKSPIICPHCHAEFDPEALLKSRKIKSVAAAPKKSAAPAEGAIDDTLSPDIENDGESTDASTEDEILDDSDGLGVIASSGNDDDDATLTTDDAIEDELDTPVVDDD